MGGATPKNKKSAIAMGHVPSSHRRKPLVGIMAPPHGPAGDISCEQSVPASVQRDPRSVNGEKAPRRKKNFADLRNAVYDERSFLVRIRFWRAGGEMSHDPSETPEPGPATVNRRDLLR